MGYASSAVQGAGTGAAIGAAGGAPGVAIGASVGLLAGLFGAAEDAESKRKYNEQLAKAAKEYGVSMDQLHDEVKKYYAEKGSLLDPQSKEEYKSMITGTDWDSLGKVDFNKDDYNVDDYYDQNKNQLIAKAENDALGAANISGSVLGSGAVGNMLGAVVSTESDLADKAFNRMVTDRNFDYGVAKDTASQRLDAVKNKLSVLGEAYSMDNQNSNDEIEALLGIKQAKAQGNLTAFMSQQV